MLPRVARAVGIYAMIYLAFPVNRRSHPAKVRKGPFYKASAGSVPKDLGGRLESEQVLAEGDGDGFCSVCRAEFREDGPDVVVDAVLAYSKQMGDVSVG